MARQFDLSIRLKAVVEGLKDLAALAQEIEEVGHSSDASAEHADNLNQSLSDTKAATAAAARYEQLQDTLSDTAYDLEQARDKAERLGDELRQSSQPTEEMRREFDRANETVGRLERGYQELSQEADLAGRRLAEMGVDTRSAASAQAALEGQVGELEREYGELARATDQARQASAKDFQDPTDRVEQGARQTTREMDKLGSRIKRLAATAAGSIAAFFGVQQAIRGITAVARTGGEMEILEKRLESIMGSLESGQQATAWIKEFTRDTPFQLQEVTEAFIRAKAFGMDPMNGTMQAIADQASQLGGDMETLNGITTALGQAYAKQKLQAEEVLQLVERGVPAWDLLAEATGKNVQQLQEMSSAGELGRKEIGLLIKAMGDRSMGAAASQMETLSGRVSNLRDAFREFVEEVNRQGFLDYAKQQLKELQDFIAEASEDGRLQQWAKEMSDTLAGMGKAIKGTVAFLVEYRDAIQLAAKAWIFYKGAQAGAAILSMAASLRTKLTPALKVSTTATNAATGALGRLRLAMLAIPGAGIFAGIALAITELPGLFEKAGTAIGEWAGKHSEAGRRLEETQRRIREEAERNIAATQEQIRQNERYRDTQVRSAEEVLAMSQDQRAEYDAQLEGLKRLQTLEYRLAMLREQAGQDTTAQQQELAQAIRDTTQAQERLATATQRVQQGIDNGLSSAAARLVEQYREMIAAGEDAEKAAKAIFETLESPGNFEQVEALIQAMAELGGESYEAADAIREELGGALEGMTGEELQVFVTTLRAAFGKGEEFAGSFADAAQEAADAAFKNLGSSLREFQTGISDAEHSAIASFLALEDAGILTSDNIGQAFEDLVGQIKSPEAVREIESLLDALERRGFEVTEEMRQAFREMAEGVEGSAEQIGASLKDAIQSAGTREELNELGNRLITAWREGKIGIDEYRAALDSLEAKHREVATSAEQAATTSKASMENAAQGAKDAGSAAKQSGDDANKATGGWINYQQVLDKASEGAGVVVRNSAQAMRYTREFNKRLLQQARAWKNTQLAEERAKMGLDDLYASTARADQGLTHTAARSREATEELRSMAQASGMSVDSLLRLDAADLSKIRNQAAQLRGEIDSLNDSLEDTVSSLEQQLANMQGNAEQAQELRYREQEAELQQQLAKAQELNDQQAIANAREALDLARQINDEKLREIRAQDEQQRQEATQQAARDAQQVAQAESQQRDQQAFQRTQTAAINRTTQQAAASLDARTVTINLDAFDQRLGTLEGVDESQANALLESIERGQLTAPRF